MGLLSQARAILDRPLLSGPAPTPASSLVHGAKSDGLPSRSMEKLFGWGIGGLFGEVKHEIRTMDTVDGAPVAVFVSALMNTVMWITALGSQAEFRIVRKSDKKDAPEGQPLLDLLAGPAGDPAQFTFLSLLCMLLYGNGYWRAPLGEMAMPTELRYIPPWNILPGEYGEPLRIGDRDTRARYWSIGAEKVLPVEVLHLRWGIDPYEPRLGYPIPRQLLSEVMLDAQSAGYSQEVLQNLGYAANILVPEVPIDETDAKEGAKEFSKKFGPGKRGSVFIPSLPLKHTSLKADVFKGLDLKELRNISEERIGAGYRVHPGAVGHGTGMDSVKVGATMSAITRTSWRAGVVPPLDFIRRGVRSWGFPLFGLNPMTLDAIYDPSAISALQEDPLERRRGLAMATGKQPWLSRNEARAIDGHDPTGNPEDDKVSDTSAEAATPAPKPKPSKTSVVD